MRLRVAHILRKYNPAEWGGTETAVQRLLAGLRAQQTENVVYCPRLASPLVHDPMAAAGHKVERFRACVPVWRISPAQRQQLVSVGGNLLSFDLLWKLQRLPGLSVIHTHTLNRLGGIAATVARARRLPLVVTIHGGVLDLPETVRQKLAEPLSGGIEWGKLFGWLLRSRKVLERADAILTCNRREAELLKAKFPKKIIVAQPHGVALAHYQADHRQAAYDAFPHLLGKKVLLVLGRIDPVKNQGWVVQHLARARAQHPQPQLHLVLAGACTDAEYGRQLQATIRELRLEPAVTLTGGLPPGDPKLLGLLQSAAALIVPSLSETFGLVILEAWAAGIPVLATPTSGAKDLVRDGENGWLFELGSPDSFHARLDQLLSDPELAHGLAAAGHARVLAEYDSDLLAKRVRHLYEELIGEI